MDPAGGRATGCRGEDEGTFARGPGFAHERMGQAEVDGRFYRYVRTDPGDLWHFTDLTTLSGQGPDLDWEAE